MEKEGCKVVSCAKAEPEINIYESFTILPHEKDVSVLKSYPAFFIDPESGTQRKKKS
jgi:hypothetical protein